MHRNKYKCICCCVLFVICIESNLGGGVLAQADLASLPFGQVKQ